MQTALKIIVAIVAAVVLWYLLTSLIGLAYMALVLIVVVIAIAAVIKFVMGPKTKAAPTADRRHGRHMKRADQEAEKRLREMEKRQQ